MGPQKYHVPTGDTGPAQLRPLLGGDPVIVTCKTGFYSRKMNPLSSPQSRKPKYYKSPVSQTEVRIPFFKPTRSGEGCPSPSEACGQILVFRIFTKTGFSFWALASVHSALLTQS